MHGPEDGDGDGGDNRERVDAEHVRTRSEKKGRRTGGQRAHGRDGREHSFPTQAIREGGQERREQSGRDHARERHKAHR